MEGLRALAADERDHTIGHLGRGLIGKAHGEDARRGDAALKESADAMRDHTCLPAPRAGEDEERAFIEFDGSALRWVELHHGRRALADSRRECIAEAAP